MPGNYILKPGKLFDSESGQFKAGLVIYVKAGRIEEVKDEKNVTANDKKQIILSDKATASSSIKNIVINSKFYKENDNCPTCTQAIEPNFKQGKIDSLKTEAVDIKKKMDQLQVHAEEITENLDKLATLMINI